MDEPLGALDKKLRDHMQLEIKQLHTEIGITVLYVTHDQEEAMVMSDRICLMNDGAIVQIGTPDDLYFRPRTVFAADFLGESNILTAEVVETTATVARLRAVSDQLISAPPVDGLGGDKAVSFMVRPEAIRVVDRAESGHNTLDFIVSEAIVAGAVTKLFGQLKDGQKVSITELTKGNRRAYSPGTTLKIGWPVDQTVILKNPAGP